MNTKHHFHFVGINGIGMSGIAKILHHQGHTISGCDLDEQAANVQELLLAGCAISKHHNAAACQDDSIDTMVYSSDVSLNSPELVRAQEKGIAVVQRAAVLADIMRSKYAIGIAGTHGKTTTTAMIGHILLQAHTDPTIVVGGVMQNLNSNIHCGSGNYIVAETDESDRSHLLMPVSVGVLTNIDHDHANTYKTIDEVVETFRLYCKNLLPGGKAIIPHDDCHSVALLPSILVPIITYGSKDTADIQAINIQLNPDNCLFDIIDNRTNILLGSITLPLPSMYNVLNATAAITTALELGISFKIIAQALKTFHGVDRRFTYKGTIKSPCVQIFDDYGHHPTAMYHSIITARRKTTNKLIVVFQPQRYTRTYYFWDQFVQILQSADVDHLIITDIYPASEPAIENITGKRLAEEILQHHPTFNLHYVRFSKNMAEIQDLVTTIMADDDLLLLLGAGKVNELAEKLL